jgi:hypothetical protein
MKILPLGAELFHAEGRADRETDRHDEAKSRFWQFCERASKRNKITTYQHGPSMSLHRQILSVLHLPLQYSGRPLFKAYNKIISLEISR